MLFSKKKDDSIITRITCSAKTAKAGKDRRDKAIEKHLTCPGCGYTKRLDPLDNILPRTDHKGNKILTETCVECGCTYETIF